MLHFRTFIPILLLIFTSSASFAFKLKTHTYIGQQVINDLEMGDLQNHVSLEVNGEILEFEVDESVSNAIINNPEMYLMGTIGPDAVPDVVVGQTFIHPGDIGLDENGQLAIPEAWTADEWLQYLMESAKKNGSASVKAFSYGFLGHAAMDVFAHTYVNQYSGDVFRLTQLSGELDETLNEERHIALESYIDSYVPPYINAAGDELPQPWERIQLTDDYANFIADTFIFSEAAEDQYELGQTALHLDAFNDFRGVVRNIAKLPIWRIIDQQIVILVVKLVWKVELTTTEADLLLEGFYEIDHLLVDAFDLHVKIEDKTYDVAVDLEQRGYDVHNALMENVENAQASLNSAIDQVEQLNAQVAQAQIHLNEKLIDANNKHAQWQSNLNALNGEFIDEGCSFAEDVLDFTTPGLDISLDDIETLVKITLVASVNPTSILSGGLSSLFGDDDDDDSFYIDESFTWYELPYFVSAGLGHPPSTLLDVLPSFSSASIAKEDYISGWKTMPFTNDRFPINRVRISGVFNGQEVLLDIRRINPTNEMYLHMSDLAMLAIELLPEPITLIALDGISIPIYYPSPDKVELIFSDQYSKIIDSSGKILFQKFHTGNKAISSNDSNFCHTISQAVTSGHDSLIDLQRSSHEAALKAADEADEMQQQFDSLTASLKAANQITLAATTILRERTDELRGEINELVDKLNNLRISLNDFGSWASVWTVETHMKSWEGFVVDASKEYVKSAGQTMLNTMNEDLTFSEAIEPLNDWLGCDFLSAALGFPAVACDIVQGTMDVKEKLTDVIVKLDGLGVPEDMQVARLIRENIDEHVTLNQEKIKEKIGDKLTDALLPKQYQDLLEVLSTKPTDAFLNEIYTKDQSSNTVPEKGLIPITDIAARVKADMGVVNGHEFNPDTFNVVKNARTLAKIALLSDQGLQALALALNKDMFYFSDFFAANGGNIVADGFKSLDGNHQWMKHSPPLPRRMGFDYDHSNCDKYASDKGFALWGESEEEKSMFRNLFVGPLSPGIDEPSIYSSSFTELLDEAYPYQVSDLRPFPSDYARPQEGCGS